MNLKTKMEKVIQGSYKNTAGIVVIKNGQPVYENYYQHYTKDETVHVASVTKSIVSALIGIAIEQGKIESLNQKLAEFFPEQINIIKILEKISLRDVMTMTAPYKTKTEPYERVLKGKQWIDAALNLFSEPRNSAVFQYSPMIGIHVLSGVLTKVTGQSVLEFANEYLFRAMDIRVDNHIKLKSKEENLEFLKSRRNNGCVVDPEGINTANVIKIRKRISLADMSKYISAFFYKKTLDKLIKKCGEALEIYTF